MAIDDHVAEEAVSERASSRTRLGPGSSGSHSPRSNSWGALPSSKALRRGAWRLFCSGNRPAIGCNCLAQVPLDQRGTSHRAGVMDLSAGSTGSHRRPEPSPFSQRPLSSRQEPLPAARLRSRRLKAEPGRSAYDRDSPTPSERLQGLRDRSEPSRTLRIPSGRLGKNPKRSDGVRSVWIASQALGKRSEAFGCRPRRLDRIRSAREAIRGVRTRSAASGSRPRRPGESRLSLGERKESLKYKALRTGSAPPRVCPHSGISLGS